MNFHQNETQWYQSRKQASPPAKIWPWQGYFIEPNNSCNSSIQFEYKCCKNSATKAPLCSPEQAAIFYFVHFLDISSWTPATKVSSHTYAAQHFTHSGSTYIISKSVFQYSCHKNCCFISFTQKVYKVRSSGCCSFNFLFLLWKKFDNAEIISALNHAFAEVMLVGFTGQWVSHPI